MRRYFRYDDQDGEHIISDEQILATYYPWWAEQIRAVGREHMITPENCLEDWISVNWAEEITDATVNKLTPPSD
jgi:hypothetical protein